MLLLHDGRACGPGRGLLPQDPESISFHADTFALILAVPMKTAQRCPPQEGGWGGWGQQLEKLYFRIARDCSDQVRKLFMVFVSKTLIPLRDGSMGDDYTQPPPKHQQRVNTGGRGQIQVWLD